MVDEIRTPQWPSDRIEAQLGILDKKMTRIEVVLLGVEDNNEIGLVGQVHGLFKSRNDCEKDIRAIKERCNMEHGKDPGGRAKDNTLEKISEKVGIKWLVLIATAGAFFGGMVAALGDRYNWW